MSWSSNLDDAEKAVLNSGLTNPSTGVPQTSDIITPGANADDPSNPYDVANIAWDLSSLNYDAPGMNGWANRLTGLTALVNPAAWVSTALGVATNEAAKNPNDNIFERAWKVATGTGWGLIGGELAGIGMIEKGAKSLLLTQGLAVDTLSDALSGNELNLEGNAWDLSQTKDIGTGEAFVYLQGQYSRLGQNVITGGNSDQQLKGLLKDVRQEWDGSDFNVFDKKDTDKFEQGPIAFFVQPLNFAAEIALDPTTYLTFGAAGIGKNVLKGAYKAGTSIEGIGKGSGSFLRQEAALVASNAGKVTADTAKLDVVTQSLADNNAEFANTFLRRRGVTGNDRDKMAYLLGEAKDKETVNDIILAFEHGHEDALGRLPERFASDPHAVLAIDAQSGGGTLTRMTKNPDYYKSLGDATKQTEYDVAFIDTLDKLKNEAINENNDYTRILGSIKDLAFDTQGTTAIRRVNQKLETSLTSDTYIGKVLPSLDKIFTQVDTSKSKFITNIIENTPDKTVFGIASKIPGVPYIVSTVHKASATSYKGAIVLNDLNNVSTEKVRSYIEQADIITGKKLSADGTASDYLNRWRSATSEVERNDILTELERNTFKLYGEKYNRSGQDMTELFDEFQTFLRNETNKKTTGSIQNKGTSIIPENNTVETESFIDGSSLQDLYKTPGEQANIYNTLDFKAFAKYMDKHGVDLIGAFEGKSGKDVAKKIIQNFNSTWSYFTLLRPARIGREAAQNSLGLILSGQALNMLTDSAFRGAANLAYNTFRRIENRLIDGVNLKNDLQEILPDGRVRFSPNKAKKQSRYMRDSVSRASMKLNALIEHRDEFQKSSGVAVTSQYDNLDDNQKALWESTNLINTSEQFHHGTTGDKVVDFADDKTLATTSTYDEALDYAKSEYVPLIVDEVVDPADIPVKIESIIKAAGEDKNVWVRLKGTNAKWRIARQDEIESYSARKINNREFSLLEKGKNPKVQDITVYGEKLDLTSFDSIPENVRKEFNINTPEDYDNLITSGKLVSNPKFIEWLNTNDTYGKVLIKQDDKESILVSKKFIETDTNDRTRAKELAQERLAAGVKTFEAKPLTTEEKQVAQTIKDLEDTLREFQDTSSVIDLPSYHAYMTRLNDEITQLKARVNIMRTYSQKIDAYIENKSFQKRSVFKGQESYNSEFGSLYFINNIGEGADANAAIANSSASDSLTEMATRNPIEVNNAIANNKVSVGIMKGDFSRYDEGLAAWLTLHGKHENNYVFNMIAEGKTDAEILDFLKNNPVGRDYVDQIKIGSKYNKLNTNIEGKGYYVSFEEYIARQKDLVNQQLYTPELKAVYNRKFVKNKTEDGWEVDGKVYKDEAQADTVVENLNKQPITREDVAKALENAERKPVSGRLNDRVIPTLSMENAVRTAKQINKLFVEDVQTNLVNIPMVASFRKQRIQQMITLSESKKGRALTADEINGVLREANSYSINQMRKWVYNVQSKSNATEALQTFVPFITAYTFTNKMLLRSIKENPAGAFWVAAMGDKVLGDLNYIDEKGDPTTLANAQSLVIPIPEEWKKGLSQMPFIGQILGDAKQVNISMKSLNVWYGGELTPGVGPLVTIPTDLFVRNNKVLAYDINEQLKELGFKFNGEGILETILPYGTTDNPVIGQVLPGWANNVIDQASEGKRWTDAYGKVMISEVGKYNAGVRTEMPTEDEIRGKVNALYGLKLLTITSSPVSFQVKTEADMARKVYQGYVKTYGQDEADIRFLNEHPELIASLQGTTSNDYGLHPEEQVARSIEKYKNLPEIFAGAGDDSKTLMGWALNTSKDYEYNGYFADYLKDTKIGVGGEKYYNVLSPQELADKASSKPGWIYFNKMNDLIDAEAISKGVNPDSDVRLTKYKQAIVDKLKEKYPAWAKEYMNINPLKYNDRADTMEELLTDSQWMSDNGNRDDVKAISQFLAIRKSLKNELNVRDDKLNGSGTLAKNKDIKKAYEKAVLQLKSESVGFSSWYNQYFNGDTIV